MKLSRVDDDIKVLPKFNQVAGVLPLVNFSSHILHDLLANMDRDYPLMDMLEISNRVEYWIRNSQPKKVIKVNKEKNWEIYKTLKDIEKKWLAEVCEILRSNYDQSNVMEQMYAICRDENKKIMRENQKTLFSIIYRLVIDTTHGPRMPLLIHVVGVEKITSLLDFNNEV
ncbi:hypothetical protein D0U04_22325 [Bacillus clarus]|uniref:Lysine--tRNA ligase n=1 Tax=Bacillus clarus TaxID=2338372 RepID=A0A090Z2E6_9BACI|nr:lysine--tRNA ligase [Bacillus clarus]RFT64396.1 hypothetical protein D0U04_22325 [Bacillus clarus]